MKSIKVSSFEVVFLAVTATVIVSSPVSAQTVLSPAQQKVVSQQVTRLKGTEEKADVNGWSDARKLAEFFCRPIALAEFKKANKQASRVFLGRDDEDVKKFVIEGNTKVSGNGSVRFFGEWKDFSFACTLDPDKGTATSFKYQIETR